MNIEAGKLILNIKISPSNIRAAKNNRLSIYYHFDRAAHQRPNNECIWSREGCYSWSQVYDRANQYGQWYLSQGVKPRDYVAFYLTNSPDFIFAWLGLFSIGAAPAMINYNLVGNALVHCLKLSGAHLLLVDEDPTLEKRVKDVQQSIEGMRICVLDSALKSEIGSLMADKPSEAYRECVRADWPFVLFYTRYALCCCIWYINKTDSM